MVPLTDHRSLEPIAAQIFFHVSNHSAIKCTFDSKPIRPEKWKDLKLITIHRPTVRIKRLESTPRLFILIFELIQFSVDSKQAAVAYSWTLNEDQLHLRIIRKSKSSSILKTSNNPVESIIREPYGASMQCDWRISVSAGSTVAIVITDMEMEERGTCNFDYLEVNIDLRLIFQRISNNFFSIGADFWRHRWIGKKFRQILRQRPSTANRIDLKPCVLTHAKWLQYARPWLRSEIQHKYVRIEYRLDPDHHSHDYFY